MKEMERKEVEKIEAGDWTVLEREIGKYYRMARPLEYDDLLKEDNMMGQSKVKAVRDSEGRIDILATFKKAGVSVENINVGEEIKW